MKKVILTLLFAPLLAQAQSLIAPAGASHSGVAWTVGEITTRMLKSFTPYSFLTQGFLQPEYLVSTNLPGCSMAASVMAYPNPVVNKLYIDTKGAPSLWSIYDFIGTLVAVGTLSGESGQFVDFTSYLPGNYIIRINTADGINSIKVTK